MEIKDILNLTNDVNSNTLDAHLFERIHNENDPCFTDSKQQEFDGIVAKGGVKPVKASCLLLDVNLYGNRYF